MVGLPVISALECDYDPDLPTYDESKLDARRRVTENTKMLGWLHHLLGGFSTKSPKVPTSTAPEKLTEPTNHKVHIGSPWILPVSVLSVERDADRHQVPKEGQCTIDTSNMQGNVASRAFVVNVLGYLESTFDKLTKVEEGHKFIGAIHLTWYHNSSTRVFRDMRFLISEHPIYDLIIGARSIQEQNILDVPNLMVASGPGGRAKYNGVKEKLLVLQLLQGKQEDIKTYKYDNDVTESTPRDQHPSLALWEEEEKQLQARWKELDGILKDWKKGKPQEEIQKRVREYNQKYEVEVELNEEDKEKTE